MPLVVGVVVVYLGPKGAPTNSTNCSRIHS